MIRHGVHRFTRDGRSVHPGEGDADVLRLVQWRLRGGRDVEVPHGKLRGQTIPVLRTNEFHHGIRLRIRRPRCAGTRRRNPTPLLALGVELREHALLLGRRSLDRAAVPHDVLAERGEGLLVLPTPEA